MSEVVAVLTGLVELQESIASFNVAFRDQQLGRQLTAVERERELAAAWAAVDLSAVVESLAETRRNVNLLAGRNE